MKRYSLLLTLLLIFSLLGCEAIPQGGASDSETETTDESAEMEVVAETESGIQIMGGFAQISIPNGAVYFDVMNNGEAEDAIVAAVSEAAGVVELHETIIDEDQMMQMMPVEQFDLPVGETVALERGGKHIMLLDIQQELAEGDMVDVTLTFASGESVDASFEVQGALTGHGDHSHGEMHDEDMNTGMVSGENESGIQIMDAFARASIPNGAVYFNVMNMGDAADAIISAESDVADVVELHETILDEDQMMQMMPVEQFDLPTAETVTLEPGGKHVMLLGIQEGLAEGDMISVTLNFANSDPISLMVEIRESLMGGHGGHGDMDHSMDEAEMEEGHGDMDHSMEEDEMDGEHDESMDMGN